MQRIQSCSLKQGRWINNRCLKKRTDFISKTVYYLVSSSVQKIIQYELCFFAYHTFLWTFVVSLLTAITLEISVWSTVINWQHSKKTPISAKKHNLHVSGLTYWFTKTNISLKPFFTALIFKLRVRNLKETISAK